MMPDNAAGDDAMTLVPQAELNRLRATQKRFDVLVDFWTVSLRGDKSSILAELDRIVEIVEDAQAKRLLSRSRTN